MEQTPPIGFVILTHSNPRQISRLIRTLNAVYNHPPIALHHDFTQCSLELSLPANVRIVQPHVVTAWGRFTLVRATLAGLSTLYSDSRKPRWFALLSGACYPTKQAGQVIADLDQGGYDAYIHHELIDALTPRRTYHDICFWRYFGLQVPLLHSTGNPEADFKNIQTPHLLGRFSPYVLRNIQCFAGAQWLTGKSEVAEYILGWANENSWLANYLGTRPAPDETYFQTILCNSRRFRLSGNNYRYIDWSLEGTAHPKMLEREDLPNILASGAHFARKFAPDSPVLDDLDQFLGVREEELSPTSGRSRGTALLSEYPISETASRSQSELDTNIKISVVIPTYRRAASLRRLLQSLEEQTDTNFEVIIVCDGEDPETRSLSESLTTNLPLKWVFSVENRYAAAARNLGIQATTGDILLFVDDDATADPRWIEMHRRGHAVELVERPIIVFGRLIHVYGRSPLSNTERLLREERDKRDKEYLDVLRNPDSCSPEKFQLYPVCGFNCSIRRSVLIACGGYDPNMRPKEEDAELGFRLHSMGVETIVEPKALLYHHDPKNLVEDARVHWKSSGRLDYYRVSCKKQRTERVAALRQLRTANPPRRLHQSLSWHFPDFMRALGELAHGLCDTTGSKFWFRQWQRLNMMPEFFEPLKLDQLNLSKLREVGGAPLLVVELFNLVEFSEPAERGYQLSIGRFRSLLNLLNLLQHKPASAEVGLSSSTGREFVLTIDTGFEDLYTELIPLLRPYSLKPLVFLVVDQIGGFNQWESAMGYRKKRLLSIEQVREMQHLGVEFGSQTCSHPWLPTQSDRDLQREVKDSKERLENMIGVEIDKFAYPYGGANARVRSAVARAGYKWAFSSRPELSYWDDPMMIKRVIFNDTDSTFDLLLKIFTGMSLSQHLS